VRRGGGVGLLGGGLPEGVRWRWSGVMRADATIGWRRLEGVVKALGLTRRDRFDGVGGFGAS